MSAESSTLYVQRSNNQSIHTSKGIHQLIEYYEEKKVLTDMNLLNMRK